jgi:hypothetical protein
LEFGVLSQQELSSSKGGKRSNTGLLDSPQEGFIKLNFDGVSKGNPGPIGAGWVFRNHKGETLLLYATNLGISSKNTAKLAKIRRGIIIVA